MPPDTEADSTELFSRDQGSIAPFAVELRRAPRQLEDTLVLARRRPAISQTRWMLAAGGAIAALSLVSALALRVPPPPPHALGQPRIARVVAAHEAVMIPARTAPAKDLIVLDEEDGSTIPVSALPAIHPVASAMPHASRGGVLRVPPSVKGILVDGAPHRVEHGVVSLPCGTHTIKAPSQPARAVTIACGGTTAL
jgi:hypothetical protein